MKSISLLVITTVLMIPFPGRGKSTSEAYLTRLQNLEIQYRNAVTDTERMRLAREMTDADSLLCEARSMENYSASNPTATSQTELLVLANSLYNNAGEKERTKADNLLARLADMNNPVALNYRGIRYSEALDFSDALDCYQSSLLATTGSSGMYLPSIHNLAMTILIMAGMAHAGGDTESAGKLVDMAGPYVKMYLSGVELVTDTKGANALPPYSIAEYFADQLKRDGTDNNVTIRVTLSGSDLRLTYRAMCQLTGRESTLK